MVRMVQSNRFFPFFHKWTFMSIFPNEILRRRALFCSISKTLILLCIIMCVLLINNCRHIWKIVSGDICSGRLGFSCHTFFTRMYNVRTWKTVITWKSIVVKCLIENNVAFACSYFSVILSYRLLLQIFKWIFDKTKAILINF